MIYPIRARPWVLLVVTLFAVFGPLRVHAESIVWNTSFPSQNSYFRDLRYPGGGVPGLAGHGGWVQFSATQDQITYHIQATDVDTGTVLAPNATVPMSDHVKFEFVPHAGTDIVWFTSGGPQDSPYGYWVAGAAPPPITCTPADQVGSSFDGVGPQNSYVAHSVNPPAKTLSVPSGMTCGAPDANGSQTCTFDSAGDYTPVFNWAATNGNFYLRMTSPRFANGCMGSSNSYYNLAVPAQTFPFPITVLNSSGNNPPSAPQLSPAASCTVGAPFAITMTSTDSDNDSIRYGVDWDADGSVDEYVPPTGYVPSGTLQTTSRTYSAVGSKTVKVLAQDSNGLASGWATANFSCADVAAPLAVAQCADGQDNDGDGLVDNSDPDCTASGGTSEFTAVPPGSPPPQTIPAADLRLSVPSLVGRGKTVRIVWSADNVTSCLPIAGTNGDTFAQLQFNTSFFSPIGGKMSSPITTRTTYTLSCVDLTGIPRTKTATVNIQPNFRER